MMTTPNQLSGRRGQRPPTRHQSRGMVLLVVMLFLIGTVVFVLTQMLGISSNNVIDGQRQSESHSAFFIAESGLEKATAALTTALEGSYTNASCSPGLASTTTIGRGSVSITAQSNPAICDNAGTTPCTSCTVTATGTVGGATRTVSQELQLTLRNGVHCTANCTNRGANGAPASPPTWQLKAKNASTYGAIGVFNLVYDNRGTGGTLQNLADCPISWAACASQVMQLDVDAPPNRISTRTGNIAEYSIGLLGNTMSVAAGAAPFVYQRTSEATRPLVEVGGMFFGNTAAPTLTGATPAASSYWDVRTANNRIGNRTIGTDSQQTGRINNGAWTPSAACSATSSTNQTCTNWCYGGDTLVYLFGGSPIRTGRDNDNDNDEGDSTGGTVAPTQLTGVRVGANGNGVNFVNMTQLVKYPTAGIAGAPTDVHAEIWYARNPNLVDPDTVRNSPDGVNVSSYKGRGTGAIGASWTTTGNAGSQLSVTTLTIALGQIDWPRQVILPNDTLTSSGSGTNVLAGTTIVQQLTSFETGGMTTGRGGAGTYQVSRSQTVSGTGRTWTVSSIFLNVSACTVCFFAQSDPISLPNLTPTNRTINAAQASLSNQFGRTEVAGGAGRYQISGTATRVAPSTGLSAGTPGTTLYLPSTSAAPAQTTPPTRIAIKSGTGELNPNTTVTSVSAIGTPNAATRSFVVNAWSSSNTPLDGATICAGTCAFFNHSAGAASETTFSWSVNNRDTTFGRWASGFICLKGVDVNPRTVSGSSLGAKRWQEVIQ